ncbi:MAG: glycosyltransferase family 4 protein, partial [Aeromonas veronii]
DDGVNGFLCEPRSTASLVSQLDRIITMGYQSRISMGLLSRQKIENEFDEKIIIAKYLEAIKTVLLK